MLYSFVHGNPGFLEYVLVRTDLDTLVCFYSPSVKLFVSSNFQLAIVFCVGLFLVKHDFRCFQQLIPILEMLYNASRRTPNQIYMLLIILLILSQDLSFNATIHKLVIPYAFIFKLTIATLLSFKLLPSMYNAQILTNVPWYQERLLHHVSLGSLMIVILIRTVNYNLSKLRVYIVFLWFRIIQLCSLIMLFDTGVD